MDFHIHWELFNKVKNEVGMQHQSEMLAFTVHLQKRGSKRIYIVMRMNNEVFCVLIHRNFY